MDKKPILMLDFDDVITNSLDTVIQVLHMRYGGSCGEQDIKKWDFSDFKPSVPRKEILKIFEEPIFWELLTFKPHCVKSLLRLQNCYDIIIASKGTRENVLEKEKWIERHMLSRGLRIDFVPVRDGTTKGTISLPRKSVAVDDNQMYLAEAEATLKILFVNKPWREWNSGWTGRKCESWMELQKMLKEIAEMFSGEVVYES